MRSHVSGWRRCLTIALTAATIAVGPGVLHQAPGASAQQTAASGLLLITVVDGDGNVLVDLQPDDFVVEEDGVAREVLGARIADYPVVLLLDDRSGAGNDLPQVRAAASQFLAHLGQRAVAIGTLANPPTPPRTFVEEQTAAIRLVESLPPNPSTLLLPLNAIAAGAALIRSVGAPFSAIVVVAERQTNPVDPESLRLLNPILESRTVVHAVARQPSSSAATAAPPRLDTDLLSDLARQTGGEYTPVFSVASYAAALDRLAERMVSELIVEYLVPRGAPAASVRVGVRVPGARVQRLRVAR